MPTIGFVLLTHNKPNQVIRLISTLNRIFDYPPIACHHDFSKSRLFIDDLANNIAFVQPHLKTGWSKFSVVEAMLTALQILYEAPAAPDWFVLLSGADYPIKPANQILDDLASSPYDVHIRHEKVSFNDHETVWQKISYERYCVVKFRIPFLNRRFRPTKRKVTLRHPLLTKPFVPFSETFRCFSGEHWFCANRRAAEYLLEFHRKKPALAAHYRRLDAFTIVPEESYYHTIFCNAAHLKVSKNHWRYIDWSAQRAHPKILGFEDLTKILASPAHFARKFDIDQDVRILDELDAILE
ncbi:MAG: beta-1,6-N-acetylglucosaminyltransferase [Leptolyngbyaceae cyanobacterium]